MASREFLLLALFAFVSSIALASDPSPLQDFCVAACNNPGRCNKNPLLLCGSSQIILLEIFVCLMPG